MLHCVTSWPKTFGLFVGGVGLAFVSSAWSLTDSGQAFRITYAWFPITVGVSLLAIAYQVSTGYEWGRRILLAVVVLVGGGCVINYGVQLFAHMSISDVPPEQVKTVALAGLLEDLSRFLLALSAAVFLVLCISHRDVVASFREESCPHEKV